MVRDTMVLIDTAPTHDSVLNADLLERVRQNAYGVATWATHNRLKHSLDTIDGALARLGNVLHGDAVKHHKRLKRHRAEASRLVDIFAQTPDDGAVQPYTVAQINLAALFTTYEQMLHRVQDLQTSIEEDANQLPQDLVQQLDRLQVSLVGLSSSIAHWRRHPWMKLAARLEHCLTSAIAMVEPLERMKQNAQFECQELGIKFYSRGGLSRVERC